MSPTTKKLSEMKGKRFASGKPQSLFAKTVGKQAHAQVQVQTYVVEIPGQDAQGAEEMDEPGSFAPETENAEAVTAHGDVEGR